MGGTLESRGVNIYSVGPDNEVGDSEITRAVALAYRLHASLNIHNLNGSAGDCSAAGVSDLTGD
jgi:hypothetical protein